MTEYMHMIATRIPHATICISTIYLSYNVYMYAHLTNLKYPCDTIDIETY